MHEVLLAVNETSVKETLPMQILGRLAAKIVAHAEKDPGRTISEIAEQHGVVFHLAEANRRGIISLSPADESRLREREQTASLRRLRKLAVFREVLDGLSSLSVDFAVLKGVAAEARYYPSFLQRAYTDLDLLVSEGGIPAAARYLESKAGKSRAPRKDSEHSMNFFVNKTHIDLHYKLAEDRFFPGVLQPADTLKRKEKIDTCIGLIPVLSDCDAFLYLILHGSKHQWCRLRWIMDLVWLAASKDQDNLRQLVTNAVCGIGKTRTLVALQLAAPFMPERWMEAFAKPTAESQQLATAFEKDLLRVRAGSIEKLRNIRRSLGLCETFPQKLFFGTELVKSLIRRHVIHDDEI